MRFFGGRFGRFLARLMMGRNGPDTIYYVSFALAFICSITQWFTEWPFPTLIAAGFIAYALFRCFSRNVVRRRRENMAFRRFFYNLTHPRRRIRVAKTHVFRKCRHCKSNLRLKYVPGKHTVRCPRCNQLFHVRIR